MVISKSQKRRSSYIDSELFGSDHKNASPMKVGDNSFIPHLLIGRYNDGYWTSAHMALQFENAVDCCLALYGDVYDYFFLFDHSGDHDRKPTGALDAKTLNVGLEAGSQSWIQA